jgi:hypothetical protein
MRRIGSVPQRQRAMMVLRSRRQDADAKLPRLEAELLTAASRMSRRVALPMRTRLAARPDLHVR